MKRCARWMLVLLIGLVGSLGADRATAQTDKPSPTSMPTISYMDPGFGFELRLPAGWAYDRTRFQDFEDSIGLLRGRGAGGRRGLQIVVFRSFDMKPFEDWIVDFGKASAELLHSERVDWETWRLPPRAGAVLTYTSKLAALESRSHYLCVPFDPNTVWVLAYSGHAANDAEKRQVREEFDQVAGSLRVHYDAEEAAQLAPAYDRGKALIRKLRARGSEVRLDDAEHFYEITLGGEAIGYLQRRVAREEYVFSKPDASRRYAKDGVRIRERSWRFGKDGAADFTRLDMFSSFDMKSELIEQRQIQVPPRNVKPQELFTTTDQIVREDTVLFSSHSTSRDRTLPDPGKPISVGPVYLDSAWVRLLPGLLLSGSSDLHAVAVYNLETRSLLSHTIKSVGERALPEGAGTAYAFEMREGFIGKPGIAYTNAAGTMLRLEANDAVIQRVSRDEIERKYGLRRSEARQRFKFSEE